MLSQNSAIFGASEQYLKCRNENCVFIDEFVKCNIKSDVDLGRHQSIEFYLNIDMNQQNWALMIYGEHFYFEC